jgi:hypothetical protein
MPPRLLTRRRLLVATLGAATATPALAHHGWRWTEDGTFVLTGVIRDIHLGNPHAHLDVDVEGEDWRVELAPPYRTRAAGFVEGSAAAGDEVEAFGNRSADTAERRMKAVRIVTGGRTYDVYPGRAAALDS